MKIFSCSFTRLLTANLLFASLVFLSPQAHAQTVPEAASAVTFVYDKSTTPPTLRKLETYSWGTQTLPNHEAKTAGANSVAAFSYHVKSTENPQNKTTQWITFTLKSEGFFSTGGHLAVIGKAQSASTFDRGRGFIIGKNKVPIPRPANQIFDGPDCSDKTPTNAWAQPESWWTGLGTVNPLSTATSPTPTRIAANTAVSPAVPEYWIGLSQTQFNWVGGGTSCITGLQDNIPTASPQTNHVYDVTLQIQGSSVSYTIKKGTQLVGQYYYVDTKNKESAIIDKLTGYSLHAVLGQSNTSWKLKLTNIRSGWF